MVSKVAQSPLLLLEFVTIIASSVTMPSGAGSHVNLIFAFACGEFEDQTVLYTLQAASKSEKNFSAKTSCRLHISDQRTNINFWTDSGTKAGREKTSLLLFREVVKEKLKPTDLKFFPAYNTVIRTYARLLVNLNLGLRRSFKWQFTSADVKTVIIGVDFLVNFSLLID